jgi:hypothetical protein
MPCYTQCHFDIEPFEGGLESRFEDRLMASMEFINRTPVVHTWTYKLRQGRLM